MKRLFVQPLARTDLKGIAAYISEHNWSASKRFLREARATFKLLASNPNLGERHYSADGRLTGFRRWQVSRFPNYVVYYRTVDERVEIARVIHSARDVDTALGQNA